MNVEILRKKSNVLATIITSVAENIAGDLNYTDFILLNSDKVQLADLPAFFISSGTVVNSTLANRRNSPAFVLENARIIIFGNLDTLIETHKVLFNTRCFSISKIIVRNCDYTILELSDIAT